MKIKIQTKIVLITTIVTFGATIGLLQVSGLKVREINELNIDTGLVFEEENYGQAKNIIVAPIVLTADETVSDLEWIQGIFYYQTSKLTFGDMTYHYIMLGDGTVYKANQKGTDQRINVNSDIADPIIIGYLSRSHEIDFKSSAKESLKELILSTANNQRIPLENVYLKNIRFEVDEGGIVSAKSTNIIAGRWSRSFDTILTQISPLYSPVAKAYNLIVEKVELPSEAVNYGETVLAKITIKNDSEHVLYQGSDFEPLVSKEGDAISKFYINDVWLSLTQAPLMTNGDFMAPGESKTFELKIGIPLYFGKQKESFKLINSLGSPYAGTSLDIELDINRPNGEIIEIGDTGIGYLNVRETASGFAPIIAKVTTGHRYFVLENTNTGWLKIDFGNGQLGWVSQQYIKRI